MKRLIFCLLIVVFSSACEKVFKEDKINKLTVNSPDDLTFALAGLYYRFASIAQYGNTFAYLFADADDVAYTSGGSAGIDRQCEQFGTGTIISEDYILSNYKPLFQTIACANDILQKSKRLNKKDIVIQHLLGEVYFIRAYSYFWLVRLFGQVPIIDNVDVSYTVKKSSFSKIYRFIESDLQSAIRLLPNSSNEARIKYVTPHRGAAKALLAEVYLSGAGYPLKDTRMYADAARLAGEVIDSADYFGFGLMPDLADLWNGRHEVNKESVFSFYSSGIRILFWYSTDYNEKNYLVTDLYFSTPPLGSTNSPYAAILFYNSFPSGYRKNMTYINQRYYVYSPNCVTDSLNPQNTYCPPAETLMYNIKKIDLCYIMNFRKYYTDFNLQINDLIYLDIWSRIDNPLYSNFGNVIYLFRYAHTLLTYAEAKARSGSLDASAYEAVNQVRRRANKVDLFTQSVYDLHDGLTPEQFADSVVCERGWEFCAEPEGRWFDLLRLEMVSKLSSLKYPGQGAVYPVNINPDNYFLPLPNSDIMLNPNLQ